MKHEPRQSCSLWSNALQAARCRVWMVITTRRRMNVIPRAHEIKDNQPFRERQSGKEVRQWEAQRRDADAAVVAGTAGRCVDINGQHCESSGPAVPSTKKRKAVALIAGHVIRQGRSAGVTSTQSLSGRLWGRTRGC